MIVDLSQDDWLKVLSFLADQPYKHSAPLINQIQNQLRKQMKPVAVESDVAERQEPA